MNIYSFLSTLAITGYTALAVYTIRNTGKRTPAKWAFFTFSLLYALWSLMYAFMSAAGTSKEAWVWVHLFSLAWTASASVFLHFVLLFVGAIKKKSRWIALPIYLPGVVFAVRGATGPLFFDQLVRKGGIWHEVSTAPSLWALAYALYYYAFVLGGLAVVALWARRSLYYKHRQQARTIIGGYAITFVLIVFNNHVQPILGVDQPRIPHLWTIIWGFSIWYAMTKYDFLTNITVEATKNPVWRLFTRRELEIISLIGQGYSYRQVADRLFISYFTVKSHVENIYTKAGVRNKAELLFHLHGGVQDPIPSSG